MSRSSCPGQGGGGDSRLKRNGLPHLGHHRICQPEREEVGGGGGREREREERERGCIIVCMQQKLIYGIYRSSSDKG